MWTEVPKLGILGRMLDVFLGDMDEWMEETCGFNKQLDATTKLHRIQEPKATELIC